MAPSTRDRARPRSKPVRAAAAPAPEAAALDDSEEALFAALKALRLSLARQRNVPAYVIFADRSLADMARRKPADEDEFADVFGDGEAKLEKFAQPFLAAIAEFKASPEAGDDPER